MNVTDLLLGILSFAFGIFIFFYITTARMKGDKGGYGAQIQGYFAAIMFILIGIAMIFTQII